MMSCVSARRCNVTVLASILVLVLLAVLDGATARPSRTFVGNKYKQAFLRCSETPECSRIREPGDVSENSANIEFNVCVRKCISTPCFAKIYPRGLEVGEVDKGIRRFKRCVMDELLHRAENDENGDMESDLLGQAMG